jgi:hypothetical protein
LSKANNQEREWNKRDNRPIQAVLWIARWPMFFIRPLRGNSEPRFSRSLEFWCGLSLLPTASWNWSFELSEALRLYAWSDLLDPQLAI